MADDALRLGAYVLPGDPVWLRSSLERYYEYLDDLVVLVPQDGLSWSGRPLPVDECRDIVAGVDTRGIRREVSGHWVDPDHPRTVEVAQRQAGIDALSGSVDWVLQIDNDEILPRTSALLDAVVEARRQGVRGVEWPMRVLFRCLGDGTYLEVRGSGGQVRFDYPGPVAVAAGTRLTDARRISGPYLRPVVRGDTESLQIQRPAEADEVRSHDLGVEDAIIHNSWGRSRRAIWRKTRTTGHAKEMRATLYFLTTWLPAPFVWRVMRDFHPFMGPLWPRLAKMSVPPGLLASREMYP